MFRPAVRPIRTAFWPEYWKVAKLLCLRAPYLAMLVMGRQCIGIEGARNWRFNLPAVILMSKSVPGAAGVTGRSPTQEV